MMYFHLFPQQALQGEEDGLEASDLLLIHTFMGLAMAAGTVIVGLVVLRPSPQCLISLQYLCQATLYGIGEIQQQQRLCVVLCAI